MNVHEVALRTRTVTTTLAPLAGSGRGPDTAIETISGAAFLVAAAPTGATLSPISTTVAAEVMTLLKVAAR